LIIFNPNIDFVFLCIAIKTDPDFPDPSFLPISKSSIPTAFSFVRVELVEEKVYNLSSSLFPSFFLEK